MSDSGPGVASAVRVARAPSPDVPRPVPPRRADWARPPGCGARRPCPTPTAIRWSSWRDRVRSWVAQAVDSACSTSSPSRSDSGVQWSAMSEPTSCGQRPRTVASVSRGDQPRSSDTRATSRPNGCGSRSSGPGPGPPAPPARRPAHHARPLGRPLGGAGWPRPRAPRAAPPGRDPPLGGRRSPDRAPERGLPEASEWACSRPAVGRPLSPGLGTTPPDSPAAGGRRGPTGGRFRCSSPVEPKLSTVSTTLSTARG